MNENITSSFDFRFQGLPIQQDEAGSQIVDARLLHEFLGAKSHFKDWIRRRIEKFGFIEGKDYIVFSSKKSSESTNNLRGGMQAPIDYGLTLDMAKQLCMVEKNDKGKEARKYFIECERKSKQFSASQQRPEDYSKALRALAASEEAKLRLTEKLVEVEKD